MVLVASIGYALWTQSQLSIQKFGFSFGPTTSGIRWSGEFGARPFIWGTLYSSVSVAGRDAHLAGHRGVHLRAVPGSAAPAADVSHGAAGRHSVNRLRALGHLRPVPLVRSPQVAMPAWMRELPLFSGLPVGVGMMAAVLILAVMVIPYTSSVGARRC